jgi:hypothetical protein
MARGSSLITLAKRFADQQDLPFRVDRGTAPVHSAGKSGKLQRPLDTRRCEFPVVSQLAKLNPAPELIERSDTPHLRFGDGWTSERRHAGGERLRFREPLARNCSSLWNVTLLNWRDWAPVSPIEQEELSVRRLDPD